MHETAMRCRLQQAHLASNRQGVQGFGLRRAPTGCDNLDTPIKVLPDKLQPKPPVRSRYQHCLHILGVIKSEKLRDAPQNVEALKLDKMS